MVNYIYKLFQYRELLWTWIQRDIKVRYKQSLLGAAWAILQPLAMMIVFTVIFSYFARMPSDGIPYTVFSYTALLPWTFSATSVTFGSLSLVNNLNLITKTYFPREILPIGSVGASFFDFLIASTLYILLMIFFDSKVYWTVMWVPYILAIQILLTLGITFITSSLIVIFRDFRFIVPLAVQLWFFITPIIYSTSIVPEYLLPLYMLNPMAGIIDSYRRVLLFGESPVGYSLILSTIISVGIFTIGFHLFKRLEKTFPDVI